MFILQKSGFLHLKERLIFNVFNTDKFSNDTSMHEASTLTVMNTAICNQLLLNTFTLRWRSGTRNAWVSLAS